ncbi:hypothetical protein [Actinoplanes sp. NPDC051859]
MGAIKPWQLMLLLCAVSTVLVAAGLVVYALKRRNDVRRGRRGPGA